MKPIIELTIDKNTMTKTSSTIQPLNEMKKLKSWEEGVMRAGKQKEKGGNI